MLSSISVWRKADGPKHTDTGCPKITFDTDTKIGLFRFVCGQSIFFEVLVVYISQSASV